MVKLGPAQVIYCANALGCCFARLSLEIDGAVVLVVWWSLVVLIQLCAEHWPSRDRVALKILHTLGVSLRRDVARRWGILVVWRGQGRR
jgi:predicted metal-binding membrane protein